MLAFVMVRQRRVLKIWRLYIFICAIDGNNDLITIKSYTLKTIKKLYASARAHHEIPEDNLRQLYTRTHHMIKMINRNPLIQQ